MADLFWPGGFQFFDDNGDPLNAGTIAFYDAGTTNPRTMYRDSAETGGTAWGTSLTLNSAGRLTDAVYYPTGAWKYILSTSAAVIIRTEDNIPGAVAASNAAYALPERPILTKATSYTVVLADAGKKINVDATGGDVTITLLSAITAGDAFDIIIQNVGATGTVTVGTSAAQTINGAATLKLRAKDDAAEFVSDGANWTAAFGAELRPILAKTADYTILQSEFGRTVTFDATTGALTATLLAATTAGSGFWVRIQKIDASANAVTVDANLSETIHGALTYVLAAQWQTITLESDGTNWLVRNLLAVATTTTVGIVEMATEAEAAARTSSVLAISPLSDPLPPGHLFGLTLSNNSGDATNDIDIAVGKARDATDAVNIILGTALVKRLDAAWTVGTNQGALDTGSIGNSVYHVWLIKRSDTAVVDVLFSLSAATPTMPASYDFKRRIGAIKREGGVIVPFFQIDDTFLRKIPVQDDATNDPGTSGVLVTCTIPTGLPTGEAIVSFTVQALATLAGSSFMLATSILQTDSVPTANLCDIAVTATAQAVQNSSRMHIPIDSTARIRYRFSASTTDITVRVLTHGWIDRRGRLS